MMLDHLDETELGKVVLGAVESVIAAGKVRTSTSAGALRQDRWGRRSSPHCGSRYRSGETSSKRTSGPE